MSEAFSPNVDEQLLARRRGEEDQDRAAEFNADRQRSRREKESSNEANQPGRPAAKGKQLAVSTGKNVAKKYVKKYVVGAVVAFLASDVALAVMAVFLLVVLIAGVFEGAGATKMFGTISDKLP